MSDVVKFVFYYGDGSVQQNEDGMDLSQFQHIELDLTAPKNWSVSQLKYWLAECLGLNAETHTVGVHALWSRSSKKIRYTLRPIDRDSQWVNWLQGCENRGSHPVALLLPVVKEVNVNPPEGEGGHDPGQSSSTTMEIEHDDSHGYDGGSAYESGQSSMAGGHDDGENVEADGDEEDGRMQDEMEDEDIEGHCGDGSDSDSSNDTEYEPEVPYPASWTQDFSSGMTLEDGHDSSWQYHQSSMAVGAIYADKQHLQEAIIQWAMSTSRVFKTTVSSKKYLTMECSRIDCPGRVHAYVPKYDTNWVVSDMVMHTCRIPSILQDHRNLSSTLIARLFYTEIVESKAMEVKAIRNKVFTRFNFNISYGKAWRAKQSALEARFGSFFDSYDSVVRLLRTLQARNPGTYVDLQDFYMPEFPTVRVLHRLFFSFGVCIEAFSHCRPVLCVDGTFLTGKYKGQILTAIGQDGNNQLLPLAFAFVESENTESWTWFFRQLKKAVVKDKQNVCVLHDRHAGILNAIKALTNPGPDEETPWVDLQSRWCMRHLGANFFSQFRNKSLMNLFKKLCKQNQEWKYNFLRGKLDEFTNKHVRERKAARNAAVAFHVAQVAAQAATGPAPQEEEPIGLCDLPGFDPPGTRRKGGRLIKNFQQWIEHEPVERWSLLHDSYGARYGVMTTNLAETYNFVLRGNRALPLTALVEGIFQGTVNYFRVKRQQAEMHILRTPNSPWCEKITKYMDAKMEKARTFQVVAIGNQERRFEVRLPTDKFGCGNVLRTHEVKIGNEAWPTCECTCNKPKLFHLPCSHVLAACGQLGLEAISFVSPYFSREAVLNTWTGEMQGFRAIGNFNTVEPGERRYIPDPRLLRPGRGRRQCRRIRNDMDESEAGGPTRQCFLCNQFGHRDTNCPEFGPGDATVRGRGNRGRRGRGRN